MPKMKFTLTVNLPIYQHVEYGKMAKGFIQGFAGYSDNFLPFSTDQM